MSEHVKEAHRELSRRVMGRPGISGTAIGEKGGKPCLKVFVSDAEAGRRIPGRIGGVPVVVERTGVFRKH